MGRPQQSWPSLETLTWKGYHGKPARQCPVRTSDPKVSLSPPQVSPHYPVPLIHLKTDMAPIICRILSNVSSTPVGSTDVLRQPNPGTTSLGSGQGWENSLIKYTRR